MEFSRVVEMIARKDSDAIYRTIFLMVRHDEPGKPDIVSDSVMVIHGMLARGVPALEIAPQLGGIVRKHILRARTRDAELSARCELLEDDADLVNIIDPESEPERYLERRKDIDDKIAVLETMRREHPRDFARVVEQGQKWEARRGNGASSGNDRKTDAANSAVYRARQRAKKLLQEKRKDKSS